MYLLFIILAARIIHARNLRNFTNNYCSTETYYKLCGDTDLLYFGKSKKFPLTVPFCYWKKYSDKIYYEYIRVYPSTKTSNCTELIDELCELETNDIVFWVNKQIKYTEDCIGDYLCYEESCDNVFSIPKAYPAVDDLPFCSADYALFASSFSPSFNRSMLEKSRNT